MSGGTVVHGDKCQGDTCRGDKFHNTLRSWVLMGAHGCSLSVHGHSCALLSVRVLDSIKTKKLIFKMTELANKDCLLRIGKFC